MKTIYKYITPEPGQRLRHEMPEGAEFLCVRNVPDGTYNHSIMMWFEVDTDKPMWVREFAFIGTGHLLPREELAPRYLGTAFADPFVWHLYEVRP